MSWRDRAKVFEPASEKPTSSWRDRAVIPQSQTDKPSGLESFGRGAAQGATFGFQDEISPVIEKGIGFITGNEAYKNRDISDLRQTYREQNKRAEAANPGAYLAGDLSTSIATTAPLSIGAALPNIGGKVLTKLGAKTIGKAAARGAAEGAAIGALTMAGKSDQDKAKAALEGGVYGALLGGVTSGLAKPALDTAGNILGKVTQSVQGLPDEVLSYLRKDPKNLKIAQRLAQNKNEAIIDLSDDVAQELSSKFSQAVSRENSIIDEIVSRAGDKKLDAAKVVDAFDQEIKRLNKGGITAPVKNAISELKKMRDTFADKYGVFVTKQETTPGVKLLNVAKNNPTQSLGGSMYEPIEGIQRAGVKNSDLIPVDQISLSKKNLGPAVTADEANILRKEVNALAEPAYQKQIGDNPVLADAASTVGDSLRLMLDDVDDHLALKGDVLIDPVSGQQLTIREANQRLKNLIEKREEVAQKFGAKSLMSRDNEIDPADVQKILTRFSNEGKLSARKGVDELSKLVNSNLKDSAELVTAVKALNADNSNFMGRIKTGFMNTAPLSFGALGAGTAAFGGGDIQDTAKLGALGTILGAGLNSKVGLNMLLNQESVRKGAEKSFNALRNLAVRKAAENKAEERK